MAGLTRIGGNYYARVYMPRGTRPSECKIPLRTSNDYEARIRRLQVEKYEDDIKAGVQLSFPWLNDEGKVKQKKLTLEDAVFKYQKSRKAEGLSKSSLGIFADAANDLIDLLGPNYAVEDIGIKEIDLYKSKRKEKYSKSTIQIRLRNFKTFFSYLKERGDIDHTPQIKLLRIPKSEPQYLSNQKFDGICNQVDPYLQRVFWFYRETGCRLREPIEGALEGDFLVTNPATSKSRRSRQIFLTPKLKSILVEIKARSHSKNIIKTDKKNPIRITHEAQFYSKSFSVALEQAKLSGYKFHNLRDTCAVRHYLKTRDIYAVKTLLGHASVVMTEKYAAFDIRRLEQDFPDLIKNDLERPIHPTKNGE